MTSLKSFRPGNLSVSGTIHQWLLVSSCFSCFLLLIRIVVTRSPAYIFLPWNLFLAFIPYWITWWMTRNAGIIENKLKLLAALAVWLLFIPNSFYIITDLFHLTGIRSAPQWFDLLLIFSFAWNGILCGIISLRRVEIIGAVIRGKGFSLFVIFIVMWLNAFGIYIGRFLRYNSWDIITDPFSLAADITAMVFHPFDNLYVWGMVSCYSIFMTLLYFTIKKLSESFSITK
jgi:uncharacterized membrane protein